MKHFARMLFPSLLLLLLLIAPAGAQTTRTILIEEFTGTWCGYCPYGADSLAAILKDLSFTRALSYHQGNPDTMMTPEGTAFVNIMNPAYPQAAIDRVLWPGESKIPISRAYWRSRANERSAATSPFVITVGGEFDQYSRVMTANVHVEGVQDVQGSFNLNVIISEDGINQKQTLYPQGGGTTYIEPYYHLHVVRKMITGTYGKQFTSSGWANGASLDTTIVYTLPSWWKYPKLAVTVMVGAMNGSSFLPLAQTMQEKAYALFTTVPVRLLTFLAEQSDKGVLLTWRTASESNNLGWQIERREAGGAWAVIGFEAGRGTTQQPMRYEYMDERVRAGIDYEYRLKQMDLNGAFEYSPVARVMVFAIPSEFTVGQNYPNPFNPETVILYSLPADDNVTVTIYDNLGRQVRRLLDEPQKAGPCEALWDGKNDAGAQVASGTYFYTVRTERFSATRRMTLLR